MQRNSAAKKKTHTPPAAREPNASFTGHWPNPCCTSKIPVTRELVYNSQIRCYGPDIFLQTEIPFDAGWCVCGVCVCVWGVCVCVCVFFPLCNATLRKTKKRLHKDVPSAQKRLDMKIWGFILAFAQSPTPPPPKKKASLHQSWDFSIWNVPSHKRAFGPGAKHIKFVTNCPPFFFHCPPFFAFKKKQKTTQRVCVNCLCNLLLFRWVLF